MNGHHWHCIRHIIICEGVLPAGQVVLAEAAVLFLQRQSTQVAEHCHTSFEEYDGRLYKASVRCCITVQQHGARRCLAAALGAVPELQLPC